MSKGITTSHPPPQPPPPSLNGAVIPAKQQSRDPEYLKSQSALLRAKVETFLQSQPTTDALKRVQRQTKISLGVIEAAMEQYSPEELSISFNGGKDCLVLLILFLAVLSTRPPSQSTTCTTGINAVYVTSAHPFPEVDSFVATCTTAYHLSLTRYALPMKRSFETYLHQHPRIKAIFVGTRRMDPHGGKLTHFDRTDEGWPDFVRIHPVVDWRYQDIWTFLRALEIPYCCLYDKGYTSLGGTTDTHPNPALLIEDGGDGTRFKPAYELVQDEQERLGRER